MTTRTDSTSIRSTAARWSRALATALSVATALVLWMPRPAASETNGSTPTDGDSPCGLFGDMKTRTDLDPETGDYETVQWCECDAYFQDIDGDEDDETSTCVPGELVNQCADEYGGTLAPGAALLCLTPSAKTPGKYHAVFACKEVIPGVLTICQDHDLNWFECHLSLSSETNFSCGNLGDLEVPNLSDILPIGFLESLDRHLALKDFFPEIHALQKVTGDFNGDGYADLAVFLKRKYEDARRGDVYVALSDGKDGFLSPTLWNGSFCEWSSEICQAGDFDGDGRDDVFSLTRGDGAGRGQIEVALSTGTGFAASKRVYNGLIGKDWEDYDVADMNGDGRDDVALFRLGDNPARIPGGSDGGANGDVGVLFSDGTSLIVPPDDTAGDPPLWDTTFEVDTDRFGNDYRSFDLTSANGKPETCHQACVADSACRAFTWVPPGVQNATGRCYLKSPAPATSVQVGMTSGLAVSTPEASRWRQGFCHDGDFCFAGDVDGDGIGDLVTIPKDPKWLTYGNPRVALCGKERIGGFSSDGFSVAHGWRCHQTTVEWPAFDGYVWFDLVDVDGDGKDDLVGFTQTGEIGLGRDFHFEGGVPVWTAETDGRQCKNYFSCLFADVNGDGGKDVVDITALSGWGTLGDVHWTLDPMPAVLDAINTLEAGVVTLAASPMDPVVRVGESVEVQVGLAFGTTANAEVVDLAYELVGLEAAHVEIVDTNYWVEAQITPEGVLEVRNRVENGWPTPISELYSDSFKPLVTLRVTGAAVGSFELRSRSESSVYRDECNPWPSCRHFEPILVPLDEAIATVRVAKAIQPSAACGVGPELVLALPLLLGLRRARGRA